MGELNSDSMYDKYQRSRKYGPHQKIELMFRRQKQIEQAVYEAKNDSHGHTGGGSSGHAFVSDPTAAAAMHMVDEIRTVTLDDGFVVKWPERWLSVIHTTYSRCAGSAEALKFRCSGRGYVEACNELHVGKSTYFSMLNDADNFALAAACQLELVRVI